MRADAAEQRQRREAARRPARRARLCERQFAEATRDCRQLDRPGRAPAAGGARDRRRR